MAGSTIISTASTLALKRTVGGIDDQSPPKKPPYKPWWHNRWTKGKGDELTVRGQLSLNSATQE
eukprot:4882918-Amphidinium_carterae.3